MGEALEDPNVLTYIQKCVDQVNSISISRVSQLKKWRLLPVDFSLEGGELTPTLKLKRKVVLKKYYKEVEALYMEAKL